MGSNPIRGTIFFLRSFGALINHDVGELEKALTLDLRNFKKIFYERIADEILAYIKDGSRMDNIKSRLLKENGIYDYVSEYKKNWLYMLNYVLGSQQGVDDHGIRTKNQLKKSDFHHYKEIFERVIDKVLRDEYRDVVERSLKTIEKLINLDGREKTIALLTNEPLEKWNRIAIQY